MKNFKFQNQESGFLKVAILLVVFVGVVWYFNIDIHAFVEEHPKMKAFFEKARDFVFGIFA